MSVKNIKKNVNSKKANSKQQTVQPEVVQDMSDMVDAYEQLMVFTTDSDQAEVEPVVEQFPAVESTDIDSETVETPVVEQNQELSVVAEPVLTGAERLLALKERAKNTLINNTNSSTASSAGKPVKTASVVEKTARVKKELTQEQRDHIKQLDALKMECKVCGKSITQKWFGEHLINTHQMSLSEYMDKYVSQV